MDPFQMLKRVIWQRKVVLQPAWGTQMITIVFQNHTVQIHKQGLQQKAGKLKREGHDSITVVPVPIKQ